jgi:hypothetical protein
VESTHNPSFMGNLFVGLLWKSAGRRYDNTTLVHLKSHLFSSTKKIW